MSGLDLVLLAGFSATFFVSIWAYAVLQARAKAQRGLNQMSAERASLRAMPSYEPLHIKRL